MFATKAAGLDLKYEKKKLREATRQREITAAGREIGELPAILDEARRELCKYNFQRFCELYFPEVFQLEWSADHLEVIKVIETTVLSGGLFALAMPRGSGKTSLCEVACVWAALYGHHQFIVLIGADADAASESLQTIKTYLETNELLAADFPEVCYPLSKLEGIQQRRLLYRGKPIRIKFTKLSIVLPDIPGSPSANVIFKVAGITGRIRGMKFTRPDKKTVRPTLCLIDDPQTDESADSQSLCEKRERIVSKAIRGLAGPGKKIAALMPCTVIRRGDMCDRLLNREIHPAWQGKRFRLMYDWPARMDLWEEYVQIRHRCQREGKPTTEATKFYKARREEMDAGAKPAWPARFEPDELSAIQNCINLRFENKEGSEAAFLCEYQNDPPELDEGTEKLPTVEQLQTHEGTFARRTPPIEVAHLFATIDVQQDLLYWMLGGLVPNFTAYILDYATHPEQPTYHFALKTAEVRLSTQYPAANIDGRIYSGLTDLVEKLVSAEFKAPNGQTLRVEKIGIDSSFKTQLIHRFCRESPYAAMLYPTHGKGIKATEKPMRLYKMEPGEKLYTLCCLQKGKSKARTTRHYVIDTNATKTFIFERFATAIGDAGSLQFYANHPTRHRLKCEHYVAEFRKKVKANDREIEEWTHRPGKPDNHWLDCLGILYALGDSTGCSIDLPTPTKAQPPKPRRVREAENLF